VIVLVGLALVVGVVVIARRRRRSDVQHVHVAGPKPWAGPSFLNGRARVRAPGDVPRPVVRVMRERPRRAWRLVPVRVVVLATVAVGLWWHVVRGLSWV